MSLLRWLSSLEWRRGFEEWRRTDGVTWIFIFKTLIAGLTALGLAMYFELPQPRVSVVTVFIVMQVQNGPVLAKAFYRLAGTVIGAAVTVLLTALVPQDSTILLITFACWIGICCAGAQWHRNFRGYGFVLAGYTTAVVGLPVLSQPSDVFLSSVWRVIEISLGLAIATTVTATIFPRSARASMLEALYQRFGALSSMVSKTLSGQGTAVDREQIYLRFAAEAVGLEGLRALTTFEDPHARQRDRRLKRLNKEFMGVCTRFNALQQYLNHLGLEHTACRVLHPALSALRNLFEATADKPLTDQDAVVLANGFKSLRLRSVKAVDTAQSAQVISRSERLELFTTAQMLESLLDELISYLQTHSRLSIGERDKEEWEHSFHAHTNWLGALAAGIRGGSVVLLLGLFWLHVDWPSGAMATLIGASTVALASTTPNPRVLALQMAIGTMAGASLGAIEYFFIYPFIDGFPLLCVALAPVVGLGAFLVSRVRWFGYGVGVLVFFAVISIPDNPTRYDPSGFINDYLGIILGMLISAVAGAVMLPPDRPWFARKLEEDLRQLVSAAAREDLDGLSNSFESRVRDIVQQAYGVTQGHPTIRREFLQWMFMVLEVGHAVIELRQMKGRELKSRYDRALDVVAELFSNPSALKIDLCLTVLSDAITAGSAEPYNRDSMCRSTNYLELMRMSIRRLKWSDKAATYVGPVTS